MENICLATTLILLEGFASKYGTGISSPSPPFDDLETCYQAPIDGCLSTSQVVLPSSMTMISMIKQQWINEYYNILRIAPVSILLDTPSKFFGH